MAKRTSKNEKKEEWRRKKKLQAQLASESAGAKIAAHAQGRNVLTYDSVEAIDEDELIAAGQGIEQTLSEPERVEFRERLYRVMTRMEDEPPPFVFDLDLLARVAKAQVKAAQQPKPDRRLYSRTKHKDPAEQTVEYYLEMLSLSLKFTRDAKESRDDRAKHQQIYLLLRDARVFHIDPETFLAVHSAADQFTTQAAGLDFNLRPEPVRKEDRDRYLSWFVREAKHQPFPDKLPFSTIFLGYGPGIVLPPHTVNLKAPAGLRDHLTEVRQVGHLLSDTGYVETFYVGQLKKPNGEPAEATWSEEMRSHDMGWLRGFDLEPWILPHLIRIINDHRTFVIETELSGELKKGIRKNRKPLGLDDKHMPKPYYTLKLHTHVVRDKVKRMLGRPKSPVSYKTDVRGHERCRIRRGNLPLDPILATKLKKRGYEIFSSTALDTETYRRLSERGLAYKRSDEWLAVKTTWVADFMSCNDPQLPYIPAVRKLGPIRTPRKPTGSWTEDPASH